jgi:histidinol phosphatase-like PHP family hydrolase
MGAEVDIRSDYTWTCLMKSSTSSTLWWPLSLGFRQSSEQITRRLLSAIQNPYVTVIAHPRGG